MNRIDQLFQEKKRTKQKSLIGYLMAGYPQKKSFVSLVLSLEKAGLDCLEIGVPFSDPIADGPTIQEAGLVALKQGVHMNWVLDQVRLIRKSSQIPIVLMTYLNPVLQMGVHTFAKKAKDSGVDGIILPDMIPEEATEIQTILKMNGIWMICLIAPTTPKERMRRIAKQTQGFLYAVSLTGVTGARQNLDSGISQFLKLLRQSTEAPVCVGFGISTPAHVRAVKADVDGVIVGSALLKAVAQGPSKAVQFVKAFKKALIH